MSESQHGASEHLLLLDNLDFMQPGYTEMLAMLAKFCGECKAEWSSDFRLRETLKIGLN